MLRAPIDMPQARWNAERNSVLRHILVEHFDKSDRKTFEENAARRTRAGLPSYPMMLTPIEMCQAGILSSVIPRILHQLSTCDSDTNAASRRPNRLSASNQCNNLNLRNASIWMRSSTS